MEMFVRLLYALRQTCWLFSLLEWQGSYLLLWAQGIISTYYFNFYMVLSTSAQCETVIFSCLRCVLQNARLITKKGPITSFEVEVSWKKSCTQLLAKEERFLVSISIDENKSASWFKHYDFLIFSPSRHIYIRYWWIFRLIRITSHNEFTFSEWTIQPLTPTSEGEYCGHGVWTVR